VKAVVTRAGINARRIHLILFLNPLQQVVTIYTAFCNFNKLHSKHTFYLCVSYDSHNDSDYCWSV